MPPLTARHLREDYYRPLDELPPRLAFCLCKALGRLARWWLDTKVLRLAHRHDPSFPEYTLPKRPNRQDKRGNCAVICRMETKHPLWRKAFLMPLCWRRDSNHSPLLPPELTELADQVRAEVYQESWQSPSWGLHPAEELDLKEWPLDGNSLRLTWDSGWAPLAGGLIACAEGHHPNGRIFASGAWNRHGIAAIGGVSDKLRLAVRWKAKVFFLPSWLRPAAEEWVEKHAPGRLKIGPLVGPSELRPAESLRHYLAQFTRVPVRPEDMSTEQEQQAQFKVCCDYYLRLPASTRRERSFYWSHLLPSIIRRCRAKIVRVYPQLRVTHCVTIVSLRHELAVLAPQVVGATHCLLLHTRESKMKKLADECRDRLRSLIPDDERCRVRAIEAGEGLEASIRHQIEVFTRDIPPEQILLDLKPGTKKMTYSQSRVARRNYWLFNLETNSLENDPRPDPRNEDPELWQAE